MEAFYRKKGRVRELLAKEKKGLFLGQQTFFLGGREWQGFYHADCPFWGVLGGKQRWRGPRRHITSLVLKIPD